MPKFDTLEPISVILELSVGEVAITAGNRPDTTVEVHPSDRADNSDVEAAQQVRVEYTNGTLRITGPKARALDFSRKSRSVRVSVELPDDSQVSADMQIGDLHGAGQLGACKLKTSVGNFWLERTGPLRLNTSAGHVTVDTITGTADITTGNGKVQIGAVHGTAVVKNSNGDTAIDAVTGDVRVNAANGGIYVGRAGAGVDAKTSNGGIRLGEVAQGSVVLQTASGDLDVGIAPGTSAYLEVKTGFGQVRNMLENSAPAGAADHVVEVRGRTAYGNITIQHS